MATTDQTAQDLVTLAARDAGILSGVEVLPAEDAADAVETLNEMMFGWAAQGVDLRWLRVVLADTLPVDEVYMEGIRYSLAVRLAAGHGEDISPWIAGRATSLFQTYRNRLMQSDDLKVDRALRPRYFNTRVGAFDIETG